MFTPLSNRVLVKRLKAEEISPGGIHIPATAQDKSVRAEVMATGPGQLLKNGELAPMQVAEGDIVYLTQWSGNEIKIEGEEYLVLPEDQILGVEEEDGPEEAEEA